MAVEKYIYGKIYLKLLENNHDNTYKYRFWAAEKGVVPFIGVGICL